MEEIIVEWRYSNGVKRWMPTISRETCSLGVGKGQWVRTHPGFKSVCHCVSWGWDDWLFKEKRVQLVASEDGLMLNTGVMPCSQLSREFSFLFLRFMRSPMPLGMSLCWPCAVFVEGVVKAGVEGCDWECGWGVLWLGCVIVYSVPRAFLPTLIFFWGSSASDDVCFFEGTSDDFYF